MAEAAGSVKIVLAVDSTSYSAALDKAKAQLKQLEGSVGSAAATTRHEMGEARGAIALLGEQVGIELPRHIRSFIATLPGVAQAMAAAFSTVAIVGIGLAVIETGKKIFEFIQQNREAAEKNAEAWKKSRESMELSNLELEASTAHLQNELAKLEGKPENKLAEEIARTAVETAKLDELLIKATDDARKMLAEQNPNAFMQLFKAGTGYEQTMVKEHAKWLEDAKTPQDKLNESISYGNSLITRRNELLAVQAGKKTYLDAAGQLQQVVSTRFRGQGDYENEITAVNELMRRQASEQAHIQDQMANTAMAGKVAEAQGRKDALDLQKQAAAKQMEEWRRELDAVKAVTDFSEQQTATYWQTLAATVKANAPLLQAATEEANKATIAANKKYQEDLKSGWIAANTEYQQQQADDKRIHDALMAGLEQAQREIAESTREQQQAARENFENTAAEIEAAERIGEAAIQLQEQRGQLSHLAAALAIQQLHEVSADQWRAALGVAQEAGANIPLAPIERYNAARARQSDMDAAAIKSATALGALQESAQELAAHFTDIPAHIRESINATVETVNSTLVRTMTEGGRGAWAQAGKQIFTGFAGTGLKIAEGSLAKFFGIGGKKGDSAGNPIFAMIVGGVGAGLTTAATSVGRLFTGRGSDAAATGIGLFGGLLKNLLHFEGGGDIPSGMPAIVGERGPELFMPSASGRIISNRTLNLGGSFSHVINVDARGAGDPAAVEAAVHRTMGPYLAQIPSITVEAMRSYNARRPNAARL